MRPLNFQSFLDIYYDPDWEETLPGGMAARTKPSDFNMKNLYQGILVELEHTSDSYLATEIAMDHLTEDPRYYQKLSAMEAAEAARRYYRNPDPYNDSPWDKSRISRTPASKSTNRPLSPSQLKKEERDLLAAIDDARYFKEDSKKIEAMEKRLSQIRQEMGLPSEELPPELPETAIQIQLAVLQNEIKTLKSLEASDYSSGQQRADLGRRAGYRRTREDLEGAIARIGTLLQKIKNNRSDIAKAQDLIGKTRVAVTADEQELARVSRTDPATPNRDSMRQLQEMEVIEGRLRNGRYSIYRQEQEIAAINKKIADALTLARQDLENIGYGLKESKPVQATPPPVVQVEELAPTPAPTLVPPPVTEVVLPPELTEVFTQPSLDPAIAALQNQLRIATQDLANSIEDREPSFVIKPLEKKVAELHAEIERRRTTKRRRRYY